MMSQAFGAGKKEEVGIYLGRTMFVITLLLVISAIAFSQLDYILIALEFDAETSRIAGRYTFCILPGLWSISMFVAISRFLAC